MSFSYRHTQYPGLFVIVLWAATITTGAVVSMSLSEPFVVAVTLFLAGLISLFFRLTIRIDRSHLRIVYGIGLIRFKFRLNQLVECHPTRHPWYYGWGIRLTPKGWLYNIYGLSAVTVRKLGGGSFLVGTDEPEVLARALSTGISTGKQSSANPDARST